MELGRSPLLDAFKRGEAPRELRLEAAMGAVAPGAQEQLELLVTLTADADAEVAATAERTLASISPMALAAVLALPGVESDIKAFFAARGVTPAAAPGAIDAPLIDASPEVEVTPEGEGEKESALQRIANMNVAKRIALAMKGSREDRAILIRDPNRIVTSAVLSSPKMTETEIGAVAKMSNVSEDVLRTIARNRGWLKNYSVILSLAKNPKTPVAISMNLMGRLTEKDLRKLSTDRNVPDALRINARKKLVLDK